jgi:hypothetical protein
VRSSKQIRNPKTESRTSSQPRPGALGFRCCFGLRPSDFGFVSVFGLRLSAFGFPCRQVTEHHRQRPGGLPPKSSGRTDQLKKTAKNLAPQSGLLASSFSVGITALTVQRRRSEECVCAVGKQDDNLKPARWFGEPMVEPARICPDSWLCFVPRRTGCAAPSAAESPLLAQNPVGDEVTKLKPFASQRARGNSGVGTARPHVLPIPPRRLGTGPHPGRGILSRNRSAGLRSGAVVAPRGPAAGPEAGAPPPTALSSPGRLETGAPTSSLPALPLSAESDLIRLNPTFQIGSGGLSSQIGAPPAENLGIGGSAVLATTAGVARRTLFAKRTHFPPAVQGFLYPHLAKRTHSCSAPRSSPVKPNPGQSSHLPPPRPRLARTSGLRSTWFLAIGNSPSPFRNSMANTKDS